MLWPGRGGQGAAWRSGGSLGGAPGGLGCGRGGRRSTPVQVFDVEHDELPALVWYTLQHQVALIVLEDLLHVFQVLLRLLDQLPRPAGGGHLTLHLYESSTPESSRTTRATPLEGTHDIVGQVHHMTGKLMGHHYIFSTC